MESHCLAIRAIPPNLSGMQSYPAVKPDVIGLQLLVSER